MISEFEQVVGKDAVLTEESDLLAYECDGLTHFRLKPSAVVLPKTTEEVSKIVKICHRENHPFVARGAGTGLSGGALATRRAVVIEMARMNRILEIVPEDRLAIVQTGLINLHLSRAAHEYGLFYAPDPSSQSSCTLGGNIAENSGGPHCLKYGNTTRHILGLEVVLASGEVVKLGGPLSEEPGYDLTGLFVGSEGTLGIATEATVRLTPLPPKVETLLAAFSSVEEACESVSTMVREGVSASALEMLDRLAVEAVESSVHAAGYPADAGAVLLIELDGHPAQVEDDRRRIETICQRHGCLTLNAASDDAERQKLWKGRKGAFGAMGRIAPDLYVLDAVVPRSRLTDVLKRVVAIGKEYDVKLCNVFHAGDGNLHPNISYDGRDEEETRRAVQAGQEILKACLEFGGTLSGEHGIGVEKRDFMCEVFDDADLDAMKRVKAVFNEKGLLNPEKIFPLYKSCSEYKKSAIAQTDAML